MIGMLRETSDQLTYWIQLGRNAYLVVELPLLKNVCNMYNHKAFSNGLKVNKTIYELYFLVQNQYLQKTYLLVLKMGAHVVVKVFNAHTC